MLHALTSFDSHSIAVGSDAMGTITFAGEGASSAQNTIDTTAAGDIWDNTFMLEVILMLPGMHCRY